MFAHVISRWFSSWREHENDVASQQGADTFLNMCRGIAKSVQRVSEHCDLMNMHQCALLVERLSETEKTLLHKVIWKWRFQKFCTKSAGTQTFFRAFLWKSWEFPAITVRLSQRRATVSWQLGTNYFCWQRWRKTRRVSKTASDLCSWTTRQSDNLQINCWRRWRRRRSGVKLGYIVLYFVIPQSSKSKQLLLRHSAW